MEWFAPKRYGVGAGLPISWQGWLVSAVFMVVIISAAILFEDEPMIFVGILIPSTLALLIISARTTRGGCGGAGARTLSRPTDRAAG